MLASDDFSGLTLATPRLKTSATLVPSGRRGGGAGEPAAHPVPPPSIAYSDARTAIIHGDVRAALRTLPASAIDCVVTSPPYWALRDYGLPPQVWDGKHGCEHAWSEDGGSRCPRCGAWRGQLGLEPSLELYVAHMVEVFREIRRVLKTHGTMWLNLGDCYNAGTNAGASGRRLVSALGCHLGQAQPSPRRRSRPPGACP